MTKKVKSNKSVSNKFVSNSILVFLSVSAKLCNFAENIKRN